MAFAEYSCGQTRRLANDCARVYEFSSSVFYYSLGWLFLPRLSRQSRHRVRRRIGVNDRGERRLALAITTQRKTSIRGLSIANPAGFSEGPAILLGAVEAEVDISSIFGDTVEIELLRLAQPQINYETKITSDNLRALLANLPSGDDGAASESAPASTKKILLKRLEILGPQLAIVTGLGSTQVTLPDIILTDIGGTGGGASAAEAAEIVLRALISSIGAANLPSLDQVRQGVENRAREEVEKIEDTVTEKVEEALGTSVEDLSNRLRSLRN